MLNKCNSLNYKVIVTKFTQVKQYFLEIFRFIKGL
nr:MAG TPA: hypothetical protein [Caudoviricetes sp.]